MSLMISNMISNPIRNSVPDPAHAPATAEETKKITGTQAPDAAGPLVGKDPQGTDIPQRKSRNPPDATG